MKKRHQPIMQRLVFYFTLLIIITALFVGIPAILLIRAHFQEQAWDRVALGKSIALVMLSKWQADLSQLSTVIAQRPTLTTLVDKQEFKQLDNYLKTFQEGAHLDFVVVCDNKGQLVASTREWADPNLCSSSLQGQVLVETSSPQSSIWMVDSQAFPDKSNAMGTVLIGREINANFYEQIKAYTSFETMTLYHGQLISTSFNDQTSTSSSLSLPNIHTTSNSLGMGSSGTFFEKGLPYYSVRFPYGSDGVELMVALPVQDLLSTQQQLILLIIGSILIVSLAGSILGAYLAHDISQPLRRLLTATALFRKGDLETPVPLDFNIHEIKEVALALEDSRISLEQAINELQRQKTWTEALLESIVEGIITLDHRGRITYFSKGAERITGIKQEDALYRSCNDVFHPVDENMHFHDFIPAPSQRRKVVLLVQEDRQITLSMTGAKFSSTDAGQERVAIVLRDVSDEENLRKLLGDFLANVTHEFRTPLSALAASIEILTEQFPDLTIQEQRELLNSLHLSIFSLQTLFDNLLQGASIETGQFKIHPVPTDLKEIIFKIQQLLQPLIQKYGQRLRISLPDDLSFVMADPQRTGQALINLLSNAIKKNQEGAFIDLMVSEIPGFLQVQVADQGPGIPNDQLNQLFSRFNQVATGTQSIETGAGLGLSVVKTIIEGQGGKVEYCNRSNGGAILSFTLPVYQGEVTNESIGS